MFYSSVIGVQLDTVVVNSWGNGSSTLKQWKFFHMERVLVNWNKLSEWVSASGFIRPLGFWAGDVSQTPSQKNQRGPLGFHWNYTQTQRRTTFTGSATDFLCFLRMLGDCIKLWRQDLWRKHNQRLLFKYSLLPWISSQCHMMTPPPIQTSYC